MIINAQNLHTMQVGFSTLYNKGFSAKQPQWPQIATEVTSQTSEETYGWIGQMPRMQKWMDERVIRNLNAYSYTIKNEPFELTVGINRDVIEDDRYGIYGPSMEMMGAEAAVAPDRTVFNLLQKGFEEKCVDGEPFFSENHEFNGQKYSNCTDVKLSQESFLAARTTIMSYLGDQDEPLNLVPDLLVVPPALEAEAKKILEADTVNGTSNITKGMAKLKVCTELAGNPTAWYLMVTSEPLKPLILQMRKRPKFTALNRDTDENVFMRKQYLYGTDGRWNAGFGFWQMAYGSKGTKVANG